ncbi:MAG TPA: hypothetical protein EYI72_00330 [Pelagibacteraceae bacterium]|jgi:predicted Zn finger-like uncharacterized protein|nr:hypothetical protein [Pelagibacteraceae bacterium]
MIIQCESCSKKFIAKDSDIPKEGRMVQCGYCSVTWHQMPVLESTKILERANINEPTEEIDEGLSVDKIKASDGKTYKFLGSQWAQLLPSGKTGLFAKKKIGKELDKLTGRKRESIVQKRQKKIREFKIDSIEKKIDPSSIEKTIDPSSESLDNKNQVPDIDKPKHGLGFLGYIFLLIIIGFSIVGILKTFENDLLSYFPETEYIYQLLDEQLEFFAETVKNMIVIVNDLISSY